MKKTNSIKSNFIYQFIYQVFVMLVPLITAPYLARTIGVEGIGVYTYYYAIAYYFVLFTKLGIDNYGAKIIAEIDINNLTELSRKFCGLFLIKLVMGLVALFLYLFYVFLFISENQSIAMIFSLYIISAIIDINWFYIGIEEFKLISIRNIIVKILTTICIFIFVQSVSDLNKYTLIMVVGTYLLSQFIGWGFIFHKLKYVPPKWEEMKEHIKPLWILFIPVLAMSIYRQMDKIMLGSLSNTYQVGLYEYTEKIFMVLMCVVSVCGDVGMPRITSLLSQDKKKEASNLVDRFVDFGLCLSFAMAFGISAIANNFIILFYGSEFQECAKLLMLLSSTIIFLCFSVIIRKEFMIPYGKEAFFVKATCYGAVVNLVLNWFLIQRIQAKGAIIATMATEFFVMVYQLIVLRKDLPIKKYILHAIWFFISGSIMFLVIKYLCCGIENTWFLVFKKIIYGFIVYLAFSIVFFMNCYKEDFIKFVERLKKKKYDR